MALELFLQGKYGWVHVYRGLMYCMDDAEENLDEWLDEGLEVGAMTPACSQETFNCGDCLCTVKGSIKRNCRLQGSVVSTQKFTILLILFLKL